MAHARVIMLTGVAGSGKDSVAKILVEEHGWTLHSLSGPLKRFAGDLFGFTHEQLYGRSSARNEVNPRWARPCEPCIRARMPCPSQQAGCAGPINDNSARRILNLLGEEYLRQMIHPDALTMRARPEVQALLDAGHRVVINDARHANDRSNLRAWFSALCVDVQNDKRNPSKAQSTHFSELDQPSPVEVVRTVHINEKWPFPGLSEKVRTLLASL